MSIEQLKQDVTPYKMKLDKYFCSTRKFVFNKYNTIKGPGANHNSFADASTKQKEKHISSTAANLYRLLESEKEKDAFRQLMHMKME